MTSLITGGSGFLGTNLAEKLLERDEDVVIYDLFQPYHEIAKKVEFIQGDVLDKAKITAACKNTDAVYHFAALVPISKAGAKFKTVNADGTRNVADASLKNGIRKFIHMSSSAVYSHENRMPINENSAIKPVGDYGRAKYEAELIVQEFGKRGLDYTIIRPRTIVGEKRAGIFQILYDWVHDGKTIYVVGDGNNLFQMVSASDLCDACYAASKSKKSSGETINIGAEKYGTMDQLIQDLIEHAGTASRIKHLNMGFARFSLKILDKLQLSPLTEFHYTTLGKPFYFDITKAKKLLGWTSKDSNSDMITNSYDWYIAHREEVASVKGSAHRGPPKQKFLSLLKKIS
jgi:nucleoside-diphosphate-sugar epimerase